MGMYVSNSSESTPRMAVSASPVRAVDETLSSRPSDAALHPTVNITPSEPVKRLGIGWRWWFSESVHLPVGNRIEFRFQGSRHLLALYNEGGRKSGETSIDGLCSSKLRGSEHRLTFVPAGRAYREWHEAASSAQVTFLYFDPAALHKSDDGAAGLAPRIYFEDPLVWETASKLKKAIESAETNCTPYLEALCGVLAHELSRSDHDLVREPAAVSRGGLAGWQKRVVVDSRGIWESRSASSSSPSSPGSAFTTSAVHSRSRSGSRPTSIRCSGAWSSPSCGWRIARHRLRTSHSAWAMPKRAPSAPPFAKRRVGLLRTIAGSSNE